ncbi:MAG: UDP-N-acetylmuramoyl-L-alanyl-D-glutamate--2,6-diaminopimelate ligase [Clostridia bacterium]|nr:UDP-N-acetylmuramoyl-L-alanyl-D-glutamate--2,6-diaminopimelate ligase [Clostridia bacterium]
MEIKMKIKDILDLCPSDLSETEALGITRLPDECLDGFIFFDLPKSDGGMHKFKRLKGHPALVVCQRDSEYNSGNYPIIYTDNARREYSIALCRYFGVDLSKIKLIGVTGTCGKTTTATLIYELGMSMGLKVGLIGTGRIFINREIITEDSYSMTTPDPELLYPTLRRMRDMGCELIVMEASSHALALMKLEPLKFDIGIFTNLSEEHLDFHPDIEDYFNTKMRLLEKSKLSIISSSSEYGRLAHRRFGNKSLLVGKGDGGDMRYEGCEYIGGGMSRLVIRRGDDTVQAISPLVGEFNAYNILCALSCMMALGYELSALVPHLKSIRASGRMSVTECGGIRVIRDFAHTPDALLKLLEFANSICNSGQNIITVFGCGGERDRLKRAKSLQIAASHSSFVVVTSDNPRGEGRAKILFDMLDLCEYKNLSIMLDREVAIKYAITRARAGDTVIIAGKGDEKFINEGGALIPFSEDEIIARALLGKDGV